LQDTVIDTFHIFIYSFQANSAIGTRNGPQTPTADPQLHFLWGATTQLGPRPPHCRGFSITHS